ncbi:hypothetical protein [Arthrobacter sp. UYCo732]|uniref:hypothetical protein n=1 Tax=Arthrobacter sp. UYCo732 TaxID=3156336 RepID=UPI003398416A
MNPMLTTAAIIGGWLVAAFCAWAFVHGAQILRRQEAAGLIAAQQERNHEQPAPVTSIAPRPARLPSAA